VPIYRCINNKTNRLEKFYNSRYDYGMIYRALIVLLCVFCLKADMCCAATSKKDSLDYTTCINLIKQDAGKAHTKAAQWANADGSMYAYHCLALAEYQLKNYAKAADALSKMRSLLTEADYTLRHDITKQQIAAWQRAGSLQHALDVATPYINELRLLTGSAVDLSEILLLRSRIYLAQKEYLRALQDVDHALTINTKPEAQLLVRAEIYIYMGEYDLASSDIAEVLKTDPNHEKALSFKQYIASLPATP
jgi:tetratricopeptide (TPR) repeat protein